MIKFRCPACGQKIAANDRAADMDVNCPSCAELIVVPWRSAPEFQKQAKKITQPIAPLDPVTHLVSVPPPYMTAPAFTRPASLEPEPVQDMKRGVIVELAHMLRNRLLQALLAQRSHLLDSQHQATAQLLAMEQRMGNIQQQYQSQINAYERRVRELERQLQVMHLENRSLVRSKIGQAADASAKEYIATPAARKLGSSQPRVLLRT